MKDLDVRFARFTRFTRFSTKRTYEIRTENLIYRSRNVVYLIFCKTCHKQYTGSPDDLRVSFQIHES